MSETLTKLRDRYPQYESLDDSELTLRVGSKFPVYLDKDEEFKKEFQGVVADRALNIARSGTVSLVNLLGNPAVGEAAQAGRDEGDHEEFMKLIGQQDQPPKDALERAARNWEQAGMATAPVNVSKQPLDIGGTKIVPGRGIQLPRVIAAPEAGIPEKVATGLYNIGASIPNFALSLEGIATMVAPETLPARFAAPLMKGLFAALMTKETAQALGTASVTKDPQDITEAIGSGALAGALTGGGAVELINGRRAKLGMDPVSSPIEGLITKLVDRMTAKPGVKKPLGATPQLSTQGRVKVTEESMWPWLSEDQKAQWNAAPDNVKRRAAFLLVNSHNFEDVMDRAAKEAPKVRPAKPGTQLPIVAAPVPPAQPDKQLQQAAQQAAPVAPMTAAAVQAQSTQHAEMVQAQELDAALERQAGGKQTVTDTTDAVPAAELPKTPTETGFRPAIRLIGGDVVVGNAGQTHPNIIDEHELTAKQIDQRGFVDQEGKFYDREQTAAATGLPTQSEPGRQHSTDLPEAQKELEEGQAKTSKLTNSQKAKLKLLGLTDADLRDLQTGNVTVSELVSEKLPGQEGRGPDHAKALEDARIQAIGDIESILAEKGAEHAIQQETGTLLRDVQQPGGTQEGAGQVPTDEGGKETGQGGGEVPQEAPKLGLPNRPELGSAKGLSTEEKRAQFDQFHEDVQRYNAELQQWEAAQPANKGIVLKDPDTGHYKAITKDPEGGWRSTSFTKLFRGDDRLAPWGHERYETRFKALKDNVSGMELVDHLPEIMTEDEVKSTNARRIAESKQVAPAPSDVPSPEQSAPTAEAAPKVAEKTEERKTRVGQAASSKRRFQAETELNGPDILSWMEENMKMLSKSAAKAKWGKAKYEANKSLWDDAAKLERPHHNIVYSDKGSPPDQVAQAAYEAGILKEPSVNELHAAMQAASKARAKAFETARREQSFIQEEGKQHSDWLKATAEGEERVSADQLSIGDMMEVDGERVEVTDVDADGNVTLKDGRKFGIQKLEEGQAIHVEKFEPSAEAAPEFGPAEEEIPKEEPKTRVQERPLTPAEQTEFQDLSIKARRAREEGGEQLTTEETKRYEELTAMAGQFDLLSEDQPSGIQGRIKALQDKIDEMDRVRIRTQERAFESKFRREELLKEAQTYSDEAEKLRDQIRSLESTQATRVVEAAKDQNDLLSPSPRPEDGDELLSWQQTPKEIEEQPSIEEPQGEEAHDASVRQAVEQDQPVPTDVAKDANVELPKGKFRIGSSPQTYTMLERLEQSEVERLNGEQPVRVRNDKTGKEEIVTESQLQAVKERTKEERDAAKGWSRKDYDDELRRLGLDPKEFPTMAQKRMAIKRQKAKMAGPGSPAIHQGPDPKAEIQQLEESFRNIQGKKLTAREKVSQMWDDGIKRLGATKDEVAKAIAGLRSVGDMAIHAWKGYGALDDMLKAKGELSGQVEERGWLNRKFYERVKKQFPDIRERAAIRKWVDAGGDMYLLNQGYNEAPAQYKQAYLDAQHLSPDARVAAENIRSYFEARLQEAIDAGVLRDGVEDYIHRIYEKDPAFAEKMIAYSQSSLLKTNPRLALKRVFQNDWEAEKEGYRVVQDFLPAITEYETSLSRAIAARAFIKRLNVLKAADGRPIIATKGLGIPDMDVNGVREGTIIRPHSLPNKNKTPTIPDPNNPGREIPNPHYRDDYVERPEYGALRKWKWLGKDAGGKPIWLQGDVAVHPDFIDRVDKLLEPSRLRFARNPKIRALSRVGLGLSSGIKQTMLDFSGFHQVQIAVHGLEHGVQPGRLGIPKTKYWFELPRIPGFTKVMRDIDLTDENVQGLLKGGLTLGGDYRTMSAEGLVGRSISRAVPGLNELMGTYHSWLFQDFIPRTKMTMALEAFQRNMKRFQPDLVARRMTKADVYFETAKQANAAFGELNYTMLERSKTVQDFARLTLLAPDFLEARGRFAAQALKRSGDGGILFGNEQRKALFLGALTLWTIARVGNQILNGQMHNEPENLFSIVYKNKAYGLRTVQGDILHLATHPVQFWMSRLNPAFGRTMLELATGRDYFGRKRSAMEQMWDAVSTAMPVSLRSSRERSIWESLANGFGITARRWNDVDDAFKLAQKWKDAHGVGMKGEFIYDANKDQLRPLKIALSNGDEGGSAREIKKLLDSKQFTLARLNDYFSRYANMPFAGSQDNDRKFEQTLSDDQKKTLKAAREHKRALTDLYRRSRDQYLESLDNPEWPSDEEEDKPVTR